MKNNEHNLYIDRRKIIFRVDKTTSEFDLTSWPINDHIGAFVER